MTAIYHGLRVPFSGDAMTLYPLTEIGQPDAQTAAMRAEYRLWGRIHTTDRTEQRDPNRRMAAVGFSNGPIGQASRIIGDGINPRVFSD